MYTVVSGGRIDASASFAEPDTIQLDTSEYRVTQQPVRFHYLKDEEFNDHGIRTGTGWIFQRNQPFTTFVTDHNVDSDTWEVGDQTPAETYQWAVEVAQYRQDELTRPNGTRYNTMAIEYISGTPPEWENTHFLHADHTVLGGFNLRYIDDDDYLVYAEGFWPPETGVNKNLILEEADNSEVQDYQGSMSYFIENGVRNRRGDVAQALHHLLDNRTFCAYPVGKTNHSPIPKFSEPEILTVPEFLELNQEQKSIYVRGE